MEKDLPKGWVVMEDERGRMNYYSPPPRVKIHSKALLLQYQKKGQCLELDAETVMFGRKRKKSREFSIQSSSSLSELSSASVNGSSLDKSSTDKASKNPVEEVGEHPAAEFGGYPDLLDHPSEGLPHGLAAEVGGHSGLLVHHSEGFPHGLPLLPAHVSTQHSLPNSEFFPQTCESSQPSLLDCESLQTSLVSFESLQPLPTNTPSPQCSLPAVSTVSGVCDDFLGALEEEDNQMNSEMWMDNLWWREEEMLSENVVQEPMKAPEEVVEKAKIEKELKRIDEAVAKLTLNKDVHVDHKKELFGAARILNQIRRKDPNVEADLNEIKVEISKCTDHDYLLKTLAKDQTLRSAFSELEQTSLHESLLGLGHLHVQSPLNSFPPNINRNLYADIIDFCVKKCPGMVTFVLNLVVDRDKSVTEMNVVEIAYVLSTLAHTVNRKNDAMTKVKTILLKQGGLSNDGLDICSLLGVTETGRSFRKLRDFLSGISEHLMIASSTSMPSQSTLDNLDLSVNGVNYHMVLAFLEFETVSTKHLDSHSLGFAVMKNLMNIDTILLTSPQNQELFEHYKKVVATAVGHFLGSSIPEARILTRLLPNHYRHPTSKKDPKPADLFTKKPQYKDEKKNSDIQQIVEREQFDYLHLITELVPDKSQYVEDLAVIQDKDIDSEIREEAEDRVHKACLSAGEYIGHGDLLTTQRFFYAKRLRQDQITAYERLEYVKYFFLSEFHLKMNKVILDYQFGMKKEVNADDVLHLAWMKGLLGLNITNDGDKMKKDGLFERHDQFYTCIGKEFIRNAFENHLEDNDIAKVTSQESAILFVLKFLEKSDIKYFFDVENPEENDKYDDLLSYARDIAGRTVVSLTIDKLEEEADAFGLRALRKNMVPYFLNRKADRQDSKYAHWLMFGMVLEESASPRTRERLNDLVCVNTSGQPGESKFRDKHCEHEIKRSKEGMRPIRSCFNDLVIEKALGGLSTMTKIQGHDLDSMLKISGRSHSSYDYIGDANIAKIREQVGKSDPFNKKRKKIDFFERSTGSVFAGMTREKLMTFVKTNKKNLSKQYPDQHL